MYRLELSLFLHNNDEIKSKIINIVRDKKIDSKDKKHELRKILFTIINKKVFNKLTGGGKQLSMAHVVKELPNLDNYIVYNVRDYCEINNTKDKCNSNAHCAWQADSCKMIITENMAVDYFLRSQFGSAQ